MPDIKLQARSGPDQFNGHTDCDFRGDKRPTKEDGEAMKTIAEKSNATDEEVALALEIGPLVNQLFGKIDFLPSKLFGVDVGDILGRIGAGDQLRIGVFDN